MAFHRYTANKIIAQSPKVYHTNKGNSYKALPLYDGKGRLHGHVIYMLHNDVDHEKPDYHSFWPIKDRKRHI